MIGRIRKKINKKFKDKDFSEIFKKSASGFFISIIGRNLGFAQQLAITNFFGAAAFGVFRVCFSLLSLVGIFGRFGVDMAISRFVAQYRKQNRYDLVNEIFQIGIKLVLPIALVLTISTFLLAPVISHNIYHKPYTIYIQIFSIGIFFFVLSGVIEEGIRGLKKIKEYSWINNVSTQAVAIAILVGFILLNHKEKITHTSIMFNFFSCIQLNTASTYLHNIASMAGHYPAFANGGSDSIVTISYVIGLAITFLMGVYYWLKFVPYKKIDTHTLSRKELLDVSIPMLSAKYLTTVYTWIDTLILAAYATDSDVGIFNGASRLTAFATMPLIAINNITGPKFAEAYGENDDKQLRKTVKLSTRLIFWSCMPIMAIFFLFPGFLLGVYGKEFTSQQSILAFHIINLGQIVNFLTGPVTQLLNMTGRQKISQRYAAFTMVTSIVLCIVLIPSMGIIGAAIATAVARTVLNLGSALHIYFTMGISTIYNPFSDVMILFKKLVFKSAKN